MGLAPEIVPSTFKEDLDKKDFRGRAAEYPVLTAQEKVCRFILGPSAAGGAALALLSIRTVWLTERA